MFIIEVNEHHSPEISNALTRLQGHNEYTFTKQLNVR